MQAIKTAHLTAVQKEQVIRLWNAEYPEPLAYTHSVDFDHFLVGLSDISHYIIHDQTGRIIGWLATFNRDEERWFSLLIDAKVQKQGLGTILVNQAKADEDKLHGWVIDHNRYRKANGKFIALHCHFTTNTVL